MPYIRSAKSEGQTAEACLFCQLAPLEASRETLVLERYERVFLMLNAFPYVSGHLMVAAYRHSEELLGEDPAVGAETLAALDRARAALSIAYQPDGYNMGANLGRVAGAGVVGHLHWHLVPRWLGDSNFMPAVAETRVLPEALPDTYDRLQQALEGVPFMGLVLKGSHRA